VTVTATPASPGVAAPSVTPSRVAAVRRTARRRTTTVTLALVGATTFAFALSLSLGEYPVPLRDVLPALVGHGDPAMSLVVQEFRAPRALTGLFAGAALGLSGAILQSLVRNPLASPDVLGFGAGASAAAVFVIVSTGTGAVTAVAGAAIGGAIVSAGAVYALAYRKGVSPYRIVLVGIGVAAFAQAIISYLLTRAQIFQASEATAWLVGSLNSRTYPSAAIAATAFVALAPLALLLAASLRGLELGDDVARGLGIHAERSRFALFGLSVLLCGAATAAAGPIVFVAFVSAPIARRLCDRRGLALVPAAVTGALVTLTADLIGQHAFPVEIPVGVVTGVVGGLYLLVLLTRSNLVGRGG